MFYRFTSWLYCIMPKKKNFLDRIVFVFDKWWNTRSFIPDSDFWTQLYVLYDIKFKHHVSRYFLPLFLLCSWKHFVSFGKLYWTFLTEKHCTKVCWVSLIGLGAVTLCHSEPSGVISEHSRRRMAIHTRTQTKTNTSAKQKQDMHREFVKEKTTTTCK